MTHQRKAVALISGGLDSLLAARVMLEQNIHVEGINFYTGFCFLRMAWVWPSTQKPV